MGINNLALLARRMDMKLLFITFFYPPDEEPRAIQVARVAKKMNANIDIVCRSRFYEINKVNNKSSKIKLYKYKYYEFKNRYIRHFLNLICIPDRYIFWSLLAIWRIKKDLNKNYDAIISFGQPMSMHITGFFISKILKRPWIVYFSDPWHGNIYNKKNIYHNFVNFMLENLVIHNCDKCFFTNKRAMNFTMDKYKNKIKKKGDFIPHSFERKLLKNFHNSIPRNNYFFIRHIGNFYGPRSPIIFLEALIYLYNSDPESLKNVKVEFIGSISPKIKINDYFDKLPSELVKFTKRVSYIESLELMSKSSLLLLIDAKSKENIFLPSKLIDYLGSNVPIFAISNKGASIDLIKEIGYFFDDSYNAKVIANNLKKVINSCKFKKNNIKLNKQAKEKYSDENIAKLFEKKIDYLVNSKTNNKRI